MSYLVLARKYRPQVFSDIVGQDHLIKTLTNAISIGRVAHAYLLCGPRGVGKTTAARILAKALNCEQGPTPVPCNKCHACVEITEGRSMDVLEIDGASNRGINEVRELRENVRYAPSGGRSKVYIIDEVHMLTTEAFNALLKTLEEPPSHVVFIFATTEPFKVPPTILSRVQRFDFARIPARKIVDHLDRVLAEEKIEASPEALALVARRAKGGLRDALSLMDQVISAAEGKIERESVEQFLGLVGGEFYYELVDRFAEHDVAGALELLHQTYSEGADLGDLAEGLATHLRDVMLLRFGEGMKPLLDAAESEVPRLTTQAERFTRDALVSMVDQAAEAAATIRRSENPRLTMELTLAEMAQSSGRVSLAELSTRLLELERRLGGSGGSSTPDAPAPESPKKPKAKKAQARGTTAPPAPPPAAPAEALAKGDVPSPDGLEAQFLEALKQKSISLWGMLHTATGIAFTADGAIVLDPSNPVTAERLAESEAREKIIQVLVEMGIQKPRVRISGVDKGPDKSESEPGSPEPAGEAKPAAAEPETTDGRTMGEIFKDEPMLQKALDMFDGEVLP